MAITFPLSLSTFWDAVTFLAGGSELELLHQRKQSSDGAGNTLSASFGVPRWRGSYQVAPVHYENLGSVESVFKVLQGRDGTFLAYDKRKPYPAGDLTGAYLDNGSSVSIGGEAAYGDVSLGTYRYEGSTVTLTQAVSIVSDAGSRVTVAGLIETVAANTLRIDHDPVTHAVRGIRYEVAFTNLLTRSEELDNAAWTKMRTTVTPNATTAPDGATTADKVVESVTAGASYVAFGFTSAGVTYVGGIFLKAAEKTLARLSFTDTVGVVAAADVSVNLSTGAITSGTGTITDYGNGWYRVSVAGVPAAGAATLRVLLTAPELDDGTSGIYVWGGQIETGSTLHSYLKTTTATVARAADALTFRSRGVNDFVLTLDNDATQNGNNAPANWSPLASNLTRPHIKKWSAIRDTQPSAATVQIKSKGSDNRSLALKGLPPFYIITKGDKLSVAYSSTKVFLCEAMETIVADYLGETAEYEIQPFMPAGLAVNDAVTLKKPAGKFKLVAGSYQPASGQGNISSGIGFSMVSVP